MTEAARAVVVGLDAFDTDIALEMVRDGRLPTLASLLDSTAWARTLTPPGMVIGAIWPSITTGCWPSRHGFYCDRRLESGTYETRKVGPRDITTRRIWDTLASAGKRCLVLDAPITVPSRLPGGAQLVEYGVHDRFAPLSSEPAALVNEVVERFGNYTIPGKCDDFALHKDYSGLRDALLRGAELKGQVVSSFLEGDNWDLCFAVLSESHCAGHQFWSYHDPSHPAYDPGAREQLGDVLLDVYQGVDAALGEVIARVPDDASLLVLLSHGIGPHYDGEHLISEILRRLDGGGGGTSRAVELRERVVRRFGRRGRHRRDAFPVDSGHRFFRAPNNDAYAGIRFNVKGREPRGLVRPGRELDAAIEQLCGELLEFDNAETGQPLFTEIIRTSDVYDGPLLHTLPDLLAGWSRAAPIRGARSPRIGTIWGDTRAVRTGDHRPGGLALVRHGDSSRAGVRGELPAPIQVVDLAPTVASWFGVELPDVDGAPLPMLTASY